MKKCTKQLLSALLVIAMMASLLIVPAAAADKTGAVGEKWDFSDFKDTTAYPTTGDTTYDGLTLHNVGAHNNGYANFNQGGTITVPVAGPCNVEVQCQYGAGGTVGVGEDTVALVDDPNGVKVAVYSYKGPDAGEVTIARTGGNVYVRSIEIKELSVDPEVVTEEDEVILKAGETGTLTVSTKNTEGKEVTWAYDVDANTVVTNVASAEAGKVTFKAEKAGVAVITLTATVEGQEYSKQVTVYVQPAEMKELTDGLVLDFTGDNGKATYLTNEYVTWASGSSYNGTQHGIQSLTGMTMKVPAGKKANLKITTCEYNNNNPDITIEGVTPTMGMDGSDPVYTFNGVTGEVNATITGTIYLHKIEVEVMDENAATLVLDPESVTMRVEESAKVTATASGYDESMKLFVVSADEKTATASVGEDGKTITITGVAAGSTTVYVTMAAAQPTLEDVQAEGSGAKAVAVTVKEAQAAGVKEWNFKVASADALPAAMEGLTSEAGTASEPARYHGTTYGVFFFPGNVIGVPVDGPSKITLYTGYTWYIGLGTKQMATQYGATENMLSGDNGKDVETTITYTGGEGVVYVTALAGGTSYLAGIKVETLTDFAPNVVDVWDFGAEQMDTGLFVNHLTVEKMNSWYPGVEPGTENKEVPAAGFTADGLTFNTNGKSNHRIRTSNTAITRRDTQTKLGAEGADPYTSEVTLNEDGSVKGGKTYTGLVYSNSGSEPKVNLTLTAKAGDKITFVSGSNGNAATYSFADAEGTVLDTAEYAPNGSVNAMPLTFFAPADGTYTYYTDNEKLVVCRVYRESGVKTTVTGTVDTSKAAGIAEPYSVVFTGPDGVAVEAEVKDGKYTAKLNNYLSGAEYKVSLKGADAFVVATGEELTLAPTDRDTTHDLVVAAVELVKVSGSVTGLLEADLANLTIEVTKPEDKVYLPKIVPAADGAYEASFEKDVTYTLTAHNVNDYTLTEDTVTYTADGTADIVFEAKPTYDVTMAPDPETVDLSAATITFTNIDEVDDAHPDGYIYTFTGASGIQLRDGQYVVKVEGTDAIQKLTPDLKVKGADCTCTVPFNVGTPNLWDFSDPTWTEAAAASNAYHKLVLSGIQKNKTYALGNSGSTIQIPVDGPRNITVYFCYAADGTIGDVAFSTNSGSTSTIESVTYKYTGEAGTVELKTNATTYITKIEVVEPIPYKATVTVGTDKEYKTINEALAAVKRMERTDERVTVLIDPGNYQEMLRVDVANVTLKNASATPSIELTNQGVDIDPNAVRITHYYGHGYAYYSMEADCTYSAERLAVNAANGRLSFENPGTGTTSGSYWNATVSIMASGFQAEGIIFENSFNQYISELAAKDVLVKLSGAKEGATPRAEMREGDTTVQEKAYVERAAALAIYNDCKQVFFDNCKFIGRQDTLYGGTGTTAGFYDCAILGGTDYIFGGMNAVFAKCDLVFNTSEDKNDVGYITAPQQSSGRGYLMYNCHVTSTTPGVDTASTLVSKPGTFGRPWQAGTSEAVFYATDVDATDPSYYTGDTAKGTSMIQGVGWLSSLSGESGLCGDYGTVEYYEGADTSADRASWAAKFDKAETADGASMTDTTAWLGGWNAFEGKDMKVVNQTPQPFPFEKETPVEKVEVTPATLTLKVDETYELTADVTPVDADATVYWTAADTKVISLSATEGEKVTVTALAKGETTITVTAGDKTATVTVTVEDKDEPGPDVPPETVDTAALEDAIKAAKDVYDVLKDTDIVADGTKASEVTKGKTVYPQSAVEALKAAIAAAEKILAEATTQEAVDQAVEPLNEAVAAFKKAAIVGTKTTTTGGGGGVSSGSGSNSASTSTSKTNPFGGKVTIVTTAAGGKTLTVTDKNGEVVAKVVIPAQTPDLGYKFTDVPDGHWAEPSIQAMAAMKVFQGVSTTGHIFDMNSAVTRGTMAQILFNLSQGKSGINNPFTDAQGAWYSDAVAWAAMVGVVTGVSDTNFAPNDSITREQLITMLYRFAQLLALDTNVTADMGKFVDANEISSWASEAMTWAVGKGLIIGKGAGDLDPTAAASRAEAAVIIDRFLQMV